MKKRLGFSRVTAFLLALIMTFSLSAPAFADGQSRVMGTIPADEPDENDGGPFSAATPFTLEDLAPYSMAMNDAKIKFEDYFVLEGANEDHSTPCELQFENPPQTISGGLIANQVPAIALNEEDIEHAYAYAHVGNTRVYYIGTLTIYGDGNEEADYIYYTTDKNITNKTVYAVLKEDEKISLVYDHGAYHKVTYQFQDKDGKVTQDGPDGWTMDDVFDAGRSSIVAAGKSFGTTVTIPRGYTATVTVKDNGGNDLLDKNISLGEMMVYSRSGNVINLDTKDGSESMKLTDVISLNNVNQDLTVTLKYEKVEKFTFDAWMWKQTDYANGRFQVLDSDSTTGNYVNAEEKNTKFDFTSSNFTWKIVSGYEMDQMEINGEPIAVPLINLDGTAKSAMLTTKLSTGTAVELTVETVAGSSNNRYYSFNISECCEDLTVSGGNMKGRGHREYAVNTLFGVQNAQYYSTATSSNAVKNKWLDMAQDTLIGTIGDAYSSNPESPFRIKLKEGYQNLHVSFTDKERNPFQTDGVVEGSATEAYIVYLNRIDHDESGNLSQQGTYETVSYDEWKPGEDGYYYLKASNKIAEFLSVQNSGRVVLLFFYAEPIKYGIDYRNGAGSAETVTDEEALVPTAPLAKDIENMPTYQNGGKNGYNIQNNATALVSNYVPVDKTGKFIFDHWEILTVENGKISADAKVDEDTKEPMKIVPGDDIHVTTDMIGKLSDCLYSKDDGRSVLTLRAVWRSAGENEPIPYIVRYYLVGLDKKPMLIEEHTHTVNKGAMLVTDLYKVEDEKLVLSNSIQAVLKGDNDNKKDYTEDANWLLDTAKTTRIIDSVTLENNVASIYLVLKTVDIAVHKVWEDNGNQDGTRPASISVQLYHGEEAVGTPATLNADGDWKHTFTGLKELENGKPIVYTVKEVTVPEQYEAVITNPQDDPYLITITNTKQNIPEPDPAGDLKVSKTVTGTDGDEEYPFNFTVMLNDTSISGTYGSMEFTNGVATFTLKHGDTKTATGLPVGVTYTVAETDADQNGYTTTSVDASGTIEANKEAAASFVNHRDTAAPGGGEEGGGTATTGSLEVIKTVSGTAGDPNQLFTFTVKLDDTTLSGEYGDLFFESGVAKFTLKDGASVTASGLPAGCRYTVTENSEGYTVSKTGDEGEIAAGETSTALFNNHKDDDRPGTTDPDPDKPGTTDPNPDKPGTLPPKPPILNTKDHFGYIIGYPVDYYTGEKTDDQTKKPVKPQGNITRAEVATIFFRMLTDDARTKYWSSTNSYTDVPAEAWYNNAVSTLTNAGIIDGYTDGSFRPNGKITRAEFATIAVRFFDLDYNGEDLFPDIDGHWAQDYINQAGTAGIIQGYPNGTFGPQKLITRAEAVTMVNRTLDRHPDPKHFLPDMLVWPDNMDTSKWYYADMQEATNSHEYEMRINSVGKHEIWTKLLPIRDWEAFEKEWSDAGSASNPGEVVK